MAQTVFASRTKQFNLGFFRQKTSKFHHNAWLKPGIVSASYFVMIRDHRAPGLYRLLIAVPKEEIDCNGIKERQLPTYCHSHQTPLGTFYSTKSSSSLFIMRLSTITTAIATIGYAQAAALPALEVTSDVVSLEARQVGL